MTLIRILNLLEAQEHIPRMETTYVPRILVADDDILLQGFYAAVLADYDLTIVGNGQEFVNKLKTGKYDLGILDTVMPVMDGMEALTRAREQGYKIPIIMASGTNKRELALAAGATDFIAKPFYDLTELENIVKNYLPCHQKAA